MNEQETNFDPLLKLLALKRHEVPPPGYFDKFAGQVTTRIRLGESGGTEGLLGTVFSEAPWLLRFIQVFNARPAIAGVFASLLFLLLVASIVYSDHPSANPENLMPAEAMQSSSSSPLAVVTSGFLDQSVPAQSDLVSSTNPVLSFEPNSSPFGGQNSLLQPASFAH
jgi:hypothetical protein